jgi:hypothetical protein
LAEALAAGFSAEQRAALVDDPFTAIPELAGLTVDVRDSSRAASSTCSVEGLYLEDGRITVMRAMSPRRTKFTALHEFGHHLARNTAETVRELASAYRVSDRQSRTLEERIADAFAAELLVPSADAAELLEGRSPTAGDVRDLFVVCEGSREACCVRMAQYMRANGYIMLAEGQSVRFCAVVGDAFPVRRGVVQDDDHLLARASRTGEAQMEQVRMRHASGVQTREYGGHAVVADDGYTYAVLTDSTKPPWGGWRLPGDQRPAGIEMECDGCGHEVEAWKRCSTCRGPVCPRQECGWCSCESPRRTRVAMKRCEGGCQLTKRFDLFPPGSDICVDCI